MSAENFSRLKKLKKRILTDQECQADQQFQQRLQQALDAHQPDVLRDVLPVEGFEAPQLRRFLDERPDHAHAGQVFLHAAGDVGEIA